MAVSRLSACSLATLLCLSGSALAGEVPVPSLDKFHESGATLPNSTEKYPQSSYAFTETDKPAENSVILYEQTEKTQYFDLQTGEQVAKDELQPDVEYKEVKIIENTPKYYSLDLKQTQYGHTDDFDDVKNIQVSIPNSQNTDVDFEYTFDYYIKNSNLAHDRVTTDQQGADITQDFVGFDYSVTKDAKGIVNNPKDATIGNIVGDFVGNRVFNSYSGYGFGGAIYNQGTIQNITGNFIGNQATSVGDDGMGGAIYNSYGASITGISGNFIDNYSGSYGGAIYNSYGASITGISGNFIDNYSGSYGGAIYASGSIDHIYGSFLGNSADGAGGAIHLENGKISTIAADFIGNHTYSKIAQGGAISVDWRDSNVITNITGNFIQNYADSYRYSAGGAIYNNRTIENINANFIGNYATSLGNQSGSDEFVAGGAIGNSRNINNIYGKFVNNYVQSKGYAKAAGGAIANTSKITLISGDFIDNAAYGSSRSESYGGAIANIDRSSASIEDIKSRFYNNHADNGGAIANYSRLEDSLKINNIQSEFVANSANLKGGAIYNNRVIENISGDFIGNFVKSTQDALGGAIYNENVIGQKDSSGNITGGIVNSSFIGNFAQADGADSVAKGGAIYTQKDLNIIANNSATSVFSGNKVISNGVERQNAIYVAREKDYKTSTVNSVDKNGVATFTESYKYAPPSLTLDANSNGVIVFNDTIEGDINADTVKKAKFEVAKGYQYYGSTLDEFINYAKTKKPYWYTDGMTDVEIVSYGYSVGYLVAVDAEVVAENNKNGYSLALTGDKTGAIYLNNDVINANISIDKTNVFVKSAANLAQSPALAVNSGSLTISRLPNQSVNFQNLTNTGEITLSSVDVDLANKSMGTITADNYGDMSGQITVQSLNLLSDATAPQTTIEFAPASYAQNVQYTGATNLAYSPLYKYTVTYSPNPEDNLGYFIFDRISAGAASGNPSDNYNPAALTSPVTTQAGAYSTQLQTFSYAFQHSENFMNIPYLERISLKNQNKYALSPTGDATDVGTFSPLFTKNESEGFWVKPYASFESIPLNNGPKVNNINYGTLIGHDSELTPIKYGFERVITEYIAYNGSSQRYQGVNATQNGALVGLTITHYKGNFFNATTTSVGASAGNATNMYGSENYTMLLAGIANKAGYNIEFNHGRLILQPSLLISYTFVNTFDYNNSAGLRIESDPLHAIQLAPGVKLIANTKSGWQPYLAVTMVWNILDKSHVTANDTRLPEMSIDPYVQYGLGVQKPFKNNYLAYAQTMIHNGGRNGISLSAGLRWKIGKNK